MIKLNDALPQCAPVWDRYDLWLNAEYEGNLRYFALQDPETPLDGFRRDIACAVLGLRDWKQLLWHLAAPDPDRGVDPPKILPREVIWEILLPDPEARGLFDTYADDWAKIIAAMDTSPDLPSACDTETTARTLFGEELCMIVYSYWQVGLEIELPDIMLDGTLTRRGRPRKMTLRKIRDAAGRFYDLYTKHLEEFPDTDPRDFEISEEAFNSQAADLGVTGRSLARFVSRKRPGEVTKVGWEDWLQAARTLPLPTERQLSSEIAELPRRR